MIGQRIKEIRNNNNLTQEELAEGIISRTYLSLIEKGSVHPSTNVLIKLSERLNCSVNDFMQEVSHFRYNDVEILREISYYEQKVDQGDFSSFEYFIDKEYHRVDEVPAPDNGRIHLLYAKYYRHIGDRKNLNVHIGQAVTLLSAVSFNQTYIDAILLKVELMVEERRVEAALDLLEDTLFTILRFSDQNFGVIRIMFAVADCYQRCGEYLTSLRMLKRVEKQSRMLQIQYKPSELALIEGKNFAMIGNYELLQKRVENMNIPEAKLLMSYAFFKKGDIESAAALFGDIKSDIRPVGNDEVLALIHRELEKEFDSI
ncbi:helix-turn-helix domain-containing protein [Salinicoccus siamensis]|uniref:Helix-turn-helix domain-containing protein n=1 Tax=Salinicoccus siamensis TaxID=381830 RepID=A0ABV5Z074_9STAP